jgi:hypothetical protein
MIVTKADSKRMQKEEEEMDKSRQESLTQQEQ